MWRVDMSSGTPSADLAQILEKNISLYKHLGISVVLLTAERVHFRVSLAKNLNHKLTAFGGSLYATAVMAAYGLVLAALRKQGIDTENIVIQKGEIKYLKPVDEDFDVICEFPGAAQAEELLQRLKVERRLSTVLTVRLEVHGDLRALLRGTFVVKL